MTRKIMGDASRITIVALIALLALFPSPFHQKRARACMDPPVTVESPPPPQPKGSSRPLGRVQFAPGVLIDWSVPLVEVDAKVVLREGVLELLACGQNSREHESVLVIKSRPQDIYHAMGLIGLEPGRPVRFDQDKNSWIEPSGDFLSIQVSHPVSSTDIPRVVPARRWLLDVKTQKPPGKIDWVFAGSRRFGSGRFGADSDGTIICLVDFDTALIAAEGLHTADNQSLWLSANTQAIPPLGTECKLLISKRPDSTNPKDSKGPLRWLVVDLMPDGLLMLDGKTTSPEQLSRLLKLSADAPAKTSPPQSDLLLRTPANLPQSVLDNAMSALKAAGIPPGNIQIRRSLDPGR